MRRNAGKRGRTFVCDLISEGRRFGRGWDERQPPRSVLPPEPVARFRHGSVADYGDLSFCRCDARASAAAIGAHPAHLPCDLEEEMVVDVSGPHSSLSRRSMCAASNARRMAVESRCARAEETCLLREVKIFLVFCFLVSSPRRLLRRKKSQLIEPRTTTPESFRVFQREEMRSVRAQRRGAGIG